MKRIIQGVEPDAPVVTNAAGGKQSQSPYAFHLLPVRAVFAAAKVAKYGADKYGETRLERNYTKIPPDEHISHAIQHLYAYLAGDTSDDHLGHALVRCMFGYETDLLEKEEHHAEDTGSRPVAAPAGVRAALGRHGKRQRRGRKSV